MLQETTFIPQTNEFADIRKQCLEALEELNESPIIDSVSGYLQEEMLYLENDKYGAIRKDALNNLKVLSKIIKNPRLLNIIGRLYMSQLNALK